MVSWSERWVLYSGVGGNSSERRSKRGCNGGLSLLLAGGGRSSEQLPVFRSGGA